MEEPYAVVALIGLPRSGTTVLHRMIAAHSKVDGIIEPYQTDRAENFTETNIQALCEKHKIKMASDRSILVKETTTRLVNAKLTMDLLTKARRQGYYTGLIILLRSPFEAYLSQVEASRTMWLVKRMAEISDESFNQFSSGSLKSLEHIVRQSRAQHFRVVSYKNYCTDLTNELARLMALFPLRLEKTQLKLMTTHSRRGDPKAYMKSRVEYSDRSLEVKALIDTLKDTPMLRRMEAFHALCDDVRVMSDEEALDRLSELAIMRR